MGPKEEIAFIRQSSSEQCNEDVKSTDGHSKQKVMKVNAVDFVSKMSSMMTMFPLAV
jgi:hypothetical protein